MTQSTRMDRTDLPAKTTASEAFPELNTEYPLMPVSLGRHSLPQISSSEEALIWPQPLSSTLATGTACVDYLSRPQSQGEHSACCGGSRMSPAWVLDWVSILTISSPQPLAPGSALWVGRRCCWVEVWSPTVMWTGSQGRVSLQEFLPSD